MKTTQKKSGGGWGSFLKESRNEPKLIKPRRGRNGYKIWEHLYLQTMYMAFKTEKKKIVGLIKFLRGHHEAVKLEMLNTRKAR